MAFPDSDREIDRQMGRRAALHWPLNRGKNKKKAFPGILNHVVMVPAHQQKVVQDGLGVCLISLLSLRCDHCFHLCLTCLVYLYWFLPFSPGSYLLLLAWPFTNKCVIYTNSPIIYNTSDDGGALFIKCCIIFIHKYF